MEENGKLKNELEGLTLSTSPLLSTFESRINKISHPCYYCLFVLFHMVQSKSGGECAFASASSQAQPTPDMFPRFGSTQVLSFNLDM